MEILLAWNNLISFAWFYDRHMEKNNYIHEHFIQWNHGLSSISRQILM